MTETLTALDATFLELEQSDEGALMSIGGVMVFDPLPDGGVPTVEEVCAYLGPRLGQLPRYSQRLSSPRTGGLAWPHWSDDERFDICAHVGHAALPAPGTDAELCDWAADFYSHPGRSHSPPAVTAAPDLRSWPARLDWRSCSRSDGEPEAPRRRAPG